MVCSKLFFCDLKNYFEVTNILLPRFSPLVVVCCLIPLANIAMPTQPAHATCWVFAGITRALSLANADWHHARECAEEEVHPRFVRSTVRPCSLSFRLPPTALQRSNPLSDNPQPPVAFPSGVLSKHSLRLQVVLRAFSWMLLERHY